LIPIIMQIFQELKSLNNKLNLNTKYNETGLVAERTAGKTAEVSTASTGLGQVVPLSDLPPGGEGMICGLLSQERKFAAMGLLPGTQVKVISHSPSYVLKAEESLFALDRQMAQAILVRKKGCL